MPARLNPFFAIAACFCVWPALSAIRPVLAAESATESSTELELDHHPWAYLQVGDFAEYIAKFLIWTPETTIMIQEEDREIAQTLPPEIIHAVASITWTVSEKTEDTIVFRRQISGTRIVAGASADSNIDFDGDNQTPPLSLSAAFSRDDLATVILASADGPKPNQIQWHGEDGPQEFVRINAPGVDALGLTNCAFFQASVSFDGPHEKEAAKTNTEDGQAENGQNEQENPFVIPPVELGLYTHRDVVMLGLARVDIQRAAPNGVRVNMEALFMDSGNINDMASENNALQGIPKAYDVLVRTLRGGNTETEGE